MDITEDQIKPPFIHSFIHSLLHSLIFKTVLGNEPDRQTLLVTETIDFNRYMSVLEGETESYEPPKEVRPTERISIN